MATSLRTASATASTKCDTLRLKPQGVGVLGHPLAFPSQIVIPSAARDLLFVSAHGFSRGKLTVRMAGALASEVTL